MLWAPFTLLAEALSDVASLAFALPFGAIVIQINTERNYREVYIVDRSGGCFVACLKIQRLLSGKLPPALNPNLPAAYSRCLPVNNRESFMYVLFAGDILDYLAHLEACLIASIRLRSIRNLT
jgi:hypothetical protein